MMFDGNRPIVQQRLRYIYRFEKDLHNGGLDCSGFVRFSFRDACQIDCRTRLTNSSTISARHGQVWDATSNWAPTTLQPGDLIFYAGPDNLPRESQSPRDGLLRTRIMAGAQSKGRQLNELFPVSVIIIRGASTEGIVAIGRAFIGHRQVLCLRPLKRDSGTGPNEWMPPIRNRPSLISAAAPSLT